MSQHDFSIANQTASSARTDINNALQALASCNSGATAPSTTYANMLWYETDTNILKMRNEANSAWISLFYVDQTSNLVHILDDTEVADTSGTKIAVLGDHTDATWTTGTNTEKRLVSPAQVKAAIDSLGVSIPLSYGSVGTYVIARAVSGSNIQAGDTISSSNLRLASTMNLGYSYNVDGYGANSPTAGTYRCMGQTDGGNGTNNGYSSGFNRTTLWLRIS